MDTKKLTDKQREFIEELLILCNKHKAAMQIWGHDAEVEIQIDGHDPINVTGDIDGDRITIDQFMSESITFEYDKIIEEKELIN